MVNISAKPTPEHSLDTFLIRADVVIGNNEPPDQEWDVFKDQVCEEVSDPILLSI